MENKDEFPVKIFGVAIALLILVCTVITLSIFIFGRGTYVNDDDEEIVGSDFDFKQFSNEDEMEEYLLAAKQKRDYGDYSGFGTVQRGEITQDEVMMESPMDAKGSDDNEAGRFSETYTQVKNIDEPDIIKTDGENIFFSRNQYNYYGIPEPMSEMTWDEGIDYVPPTNQLSIIDAFPPEDMEEISQLSEDGDLLLFEDMLLVLQYSKIQAYDVSTPSAPSQKWSLDMEENTYYSDARLSEGKLFLIVITRPSDDKLCPIRMLDKFEPILCSDVYYPVHDSVADLVYTIMEIDPSEGKIKDKVSFMGSLSSSVIYMSPDNLYVTYSRYEDEMTIMLDFVIDNSDLFPGDFVESIKKVKSYDLSEEAKIAEYEVLFSDFQQSMTTKEWDIFEEKLEERLTTFFRKHQRDFESTGIVKIALETLKLKATVEIPGVTLNQFSLDEYQDHLRIAVSMGSIGGLADSTNDLYILDKDLKISGYIKDYGLDERIYAVRFTGHLGYIVTFRQIDPFYVMNLSDPKNPSITGELKIPGFSSFLHPIDHDTVLGIGKQDNQVKVSLFDVSDPKTPEELDVAVLKEYSSDILNTHHAFHIDTEKSIFFIPGYDDGYIFSYEGNKLELVKIVTNIEAKRALYIDDYMYIVGNDKIKVFDENNWEEVNRILFD